MVSDKEAYSEPPEEPRRAIKGLPFEERPTEIPPDSPRVFDAMERAARYLKESGDTAK